MEQLLGQEIWDMFCSYKFSFLVIGLVYRRAKWFYASLLHLLWV